MQELKNLTFVDLYAMYHFVQEEQTKCPNSSVVINKLKTIEKELYNRTYGSNSPSVVNSVVFSSNTLPENINLDNFDQVKTDEP